MLEIQSIEIAFLLQMQAFEHLFWFCSDNRGNWYHKQLENRLLQAALIRESPFTEAGLQFFSMQIQELLPLNGFQLFWMWKVWFFCKCKFLLHRFLSLPDLLLEVEMRNRIEDTSGFERKYFFIFWQNRWSISKKICDGHSVAVTFPDLGQQDSETEESKFIEALIRSFEAGQNSMYRGTFLIRSLNYGFSSNMSVYLAHGKLNVELLSNWQIIQKVIAEIDLQNKRKHLSPSCWLEVSRRRTKKRQHDSCC